MTKKDFKQFADALAEIKGGIIQDETRENMIKQLCPIFKSNNYRFDEARFREWIDRKVNGESTKGLG